MFLMFSGGKQPWSGGKRQWKYHSTRKIPRSGKQALNERKISILIARGRRGQVQYRNFEFTIPSASMCICKQDTSLTVSSTLNI